MTDKFSTLYLHSHRPLRKSSNIIPSLIKTHLSWFSLPMAMEFFQTFSWNISSRSFSIHPQKQRNAYTKYINTHQYKWYYFKTCHWSSLLFNSFEKKLRINIHIYMKNIHIYIHIYMNAYIDTCDAYIHLRFLL